jgi:hypothetical protein
MHRERRGVPAYADSGSRPAAHRSARARRAMTRRRRTRVASRWPTSGPRLRAVSEPPSVSHGRRPGSRAAVRRSAQRPGRREHRTRRSSSTSR